MKKRYLTEALPPFGTPERRVVRVALLDYRDRLMSAIENAVFNETLTEEKIGQLEFWKDKVELKLYGN